MQSVYRDPSFPAELRLDAAAKAARFERPTLQATLVRDVTPQPVTQADANRRIQELLERGLAHVQIDAGADGSDFSRQVWPKRRAEDKATQLLNGDGAFRHTHDIQVIIWVKGASTWRVSTGGWGLRCGPF